VRRNRRALPALAACLLLALATGSAQAEAIDVKATPVPLDERDSSRQSVGELEFLAGFELTSPEPKWGSLSGLVIAANGTSLIAVADTGCWFRLSLQQDATGRLTGIGSAEVFPVLDTAGNPVPDKRHGDAEALARGPDGSLIVAFEQQHRLWRYGPAGDPLASPAVPVRIPRAARGLPRNGGIEALATLRSGRLVLLSEEGKSPSGDLRGWLQGKSGWTEIAVARTGAFLPTDLARLPDGDLLLLERQVGLIGGFAARLSVLPAKALGSGAIITGREIATIMAPLTVDNFEALATRKGADGSTLIYLATDDNQNLFERTLLLQFRWHPAP
jgi:hypothetical protein